VDHIAYLTAISLLGNSLKTAVLITSYNYCLINNNNNNNSKLKTFLFDADAN